MLRILTLAVIIAAIATIIYNPTSLPFIGGPSDSTVKRVVTDYAADERYVGADFFARVIGQPVKVERYHVDEQMLYLSIAADDYREELSAQLAVDAQAVEYGKTPAGHFKINPDERRPIELGTYKYRAWDRYFLRVPVDQLKVDVDQSITFPFRSTNYTITPTELHDFITNRSVTGGYLNVATTVGGQNVRFSNHGVMVAKKGEPSLTRLVDQLVDRSDPIERQIQTLLDFVTYEIAYDEQLDFIAGEVLRRPNEAIMAGRADCGNKVVLFASLLEQLGVDYQLAYTGVAADLDHMFVLVAGNFQAQDGYTMTIDGTKYHAAETTARGFQIGESRLNVDLVDRPYLFLQKRPDAEVYDARRRTTLAFL